EESRLELPIREVTRLGQFRTDGVVPEPDFYRAAGDLPPDFANEMFADGGVGRKQVVSQSRVWLPRGIQAADTSEATRRFVGGDSLALRSDISRVVLAGELAIFGDDDDAELAAPTTYPESGIAYGTESSDQAGLTRRRLRHPETEAQTWV
ncbi:MAG: hypothetical protein FWG25_06495, partial [Promicromonosporaceae bacterium]|nr:hypothetical protein [Promicromonosporaceae bacterium]